MQDKQEQPVNAKQIDINNYSLLNNNMATTEIKNRNQGIQEFLKRDDKTVNVDVEKLKKQYFGQTKLDQTEKTKEDLDTYIKY